MKEHDKNRHNIGIPSRFLRHKSAHRTHSPDYRKNQNVPEKLPSLIGEHKKIQVQRQPINEPKPPISSQMDHSINKIEEEENDWMMDSINESSFEIKSSEPTQPDLSGSPKPISINTPMSPFPTSDASK